jgi:hypothetical protein
MPELYPSEKALSVNGFRAAIVFDKRGSPPAPRTRRRAFDVTSFATAVASAKERQRLKFTSGCDLLSALKLRPQPLTNVGSA